MIEGFAPDAPYPYPAVSGILDKLSAQDPRFIVLFGNAMAAFPGRPGGEFAKLLAAHWRSVPPQMANSAVQMIVSHVLDQKVEEDTVETLTLSSAKGSVHFGGSLPRRVTGLGSLLRCGNRRLATMSPEHMTGEPATKAGSNVLVPAATMLTSR